MKLSRPPDPRFAANRQFAADRALRGLATLDPAAARQVVRWLGHDYQAANERIEEALGAALAAGDWELRASAMLVAARLGAASLAAAVRRVELPRTSREGLNATDRQALLALQKAAAALLNGHPVPADADHRPSTREEMRSHVLRCAGGAATRWPDRVWLLAHALTTPLPEAAAPPADLPEAIIMDDEGIYRLALTGVALAWVSPGTFWLGDEGPELPSPNPIRQVTLTEGFFIAARPVAVPFLKPRPDELPAVYTWREAQAICEELSAIEGVEIGLPKADEWEMAARGMDGRRFPWGNGYEEDMFARPAPCGAEAMAGVCGQWTGDAVDGRFIVCGDAHHLRCAARLPALPTSAYAVRPVVRLAAATAPASRIVGANLRVCPTVVRPAAATAPTSRIVGANLRVCPTVVRLAAATAPTRE